jgi:hypothetical protein
MNEKEHSNVFRFSLNQGKIVNGEFVSEILLCEAMFDADKFNPFTRYSIDVRDILPKAITRLQKTLSRRGYDVVAEVGRQNTSDEDSEMQVYDLYGYQQKLINLYPRPWRNGMRYNPASVVQEVEHRGERKTIRGVPCKIGLYINDNPIVEREFFVDGFNPVAKQSLDIKHAVTDISESIEAKIKKNDIRNMWDDYDLINFRGLSINQIRELHPAKRAEMLRRLRRN